MSDSVLPIEGLMEKGGSDTEASSSSWDDLPVDLLEEVMTRISLSDQVRFRAVCKNMLAIDIPFSNSLPWIISIQNLYEYDKQHSRINNVEVYRHYESSSSYHSYQLKTTFDRKDLRIIQNFQQCRLCIDTVCVNGWIFYSVQNSSRKRVSFLLFSPLTKQVIKLPSIFHWPNNDSEFIRSFSSDPNSPDCVFFILHRKFNVRRFTIKTWRRGDKNWTSREFDKPYSFYGCRRIPLYIGRNFYFVSPTGNIASYDIARGEWKVHNVLFEDLGPEYPVYNLVHQAFEMNGDIMIVHFMKPSSMEEEYVPFGFITKLNSSSNVWVPIKSLGDHVLFVDENSCLAKNIDREARSNGVFPNKIYCLQYSTCHVYSLEDGKLTFNATYRDKVLNIYRGFWFEPPNHIVKEKTWDDPEDQFVENDEELENLKLLDQMRRSRNHPTYKDTGGKHRRKK